MTTRRTASDRWSFLRESVRSLPAVGAVAPSSRVLARAIVHPLTVPRGRAVRVLEVGPGTGVCTTELLARLGADDELDVVEVNATFARRIRELVVGAVPTVRVHEALVQEVDLTGPYDAIVCGVPLTNLPPEVVGAVMDQLLGLLAPGGVLGYFAYVGTLPLRRLTSTPASARRHAEVERLLAQLHARRGLRSRIVLANLPPARARFLLG